jgi:hypothetical protein
MIERLKHIGCLPVIALILFITGGVFGEGLIETAGSKI